MSTRAAIRIQDGNQELWFYCHSEGYPVGVSHENQIRGVLPDLLKMRQWLQEGSIRGNLKQASGWLVILGREILLQTQASINPDQEPPPNFEPREKRQPLAWKASHYEPCPTAQALQDYKFLYTLQLNPPSITIDHPRPAKTAPKPIQLSLH